MANDNSIKFVMDPGASAVRSDLAALINTGTKESPVWSPVGSGVESSDLGMEWNTETKTDIFGKVYTSAKKPEKTQDFDSWPMKTDEAILHIWKMAVWEEDVAKVTNQDMLIVHKYAKKNGKFLAKRYENCTVIPTSIGGDGGGVLQTTVSVTYGGKETLGTFDRDSTGKAIFTPEDEATGASAASLSDEEL